MGLEILEQYGVCRLLIFLLNHPEGVLRSQYRDKPLSLSASTARRDHEALYDVGLIHSIEHKAKLLFVLTTKGREIAERLKEIEGFLINENENTLE